MAVIPSISSFSRAVAMQLRFFFVSDTNVRMISFAALGSSSEKAVRAEKSNEDESVCELSLVGACRISVPVSSKSVKSCRMACERTSKISCVLKGLWRHPAKPLERKYSASMSLRAVMAITGIVFARTAGSARMASNRSKPFMAGICMSVRSASNLFSSN